MISASLRRTGQAPNVEVFTVIHSGGAVSQEVAEELVCTARWWMSDADSGAQRRVDIWVPPGQQRLHACLAVVSLFGMAPIAIFLHGTTLVARLKAADVPVRHRMGSAAAHTDAELAALLSGWPLRYV